MTFRSEGQSHGHRQSTRAKARRPSLLIASCLVLGIRPITGESALPWAFAVTDLLGNPKLKLDERF